MKLLTVSKLRGDRCKCANCGHYFNSTSAFDKHRVGKYMPDSRRCLSITEMFEKMVINGKGYWITAKKPEF